MNASLTEIVIWPVDKSLDGKASFSIHANVPQILCVETQMPFAVGYEGKAVNELAANILQIVGMMSGYDGPIVDYLEGTQGYRFLSDLSATQNGVQREIAVYRYFAQQYLYRMLPEKGGRYSITELNLWLAHNSQEYSRYLAGDAY